MSAALKALAAWLGATVLATVGLLAVNWLFRKVLDDDSLNLWLGLVFALCVYAALFKAASHLLRHPRGWPAAGLTSFAFIVCLPAFLVWLDDSDGPEIRAQAPIPGRIDLAIVAPVPLEGIGSRPPAPPGDLAAWDVRYTVATPSGQGDDLDVLVAGTDSRGAALRALRTGQRLEPGLAAVEWRPEAERAVVLVATGPRPDRRLVAAGRSLEAPAVVLGPGEDPTGPTPVDSALRLVAQSRTALADR